MDWQARDREWAGVDIGAWYRTHQTCPSCGVNLRQMHPCSNIYPHWTGACIEIEEAVNLPEQIDSPSLWTRLREFRRRFLA